MLERRGNLKRRQHDGIGCGVDEPSLHAKFPNPANANVFFVQVKKKKKITPNQAQLKLSSFLLKLSSFLLRT